MPTVTRSYLHDDLYAVALGYAVEIIRYVVEIIIYLDNHCAIVLCLVDYGIIFKQNELFYKSSILSAR
jgi:hypothetical protein